MYVVQGRNALNQWQDIGDYDDDVTATAHLKHHAERLQRDGFNLMRTSTRLYAKDKTGTVLVFRIITR